MTNDVITSQRAEVILSSIVGTYSWFVRSDQSRIFRMEFGDPYLYIRDPFEPVIGASDAANAALTRRVVLPTGRWSLVVEDGLWAIEMDGLTCNKETDDYSICEKCMSLLSGQKVESIDIFAKKFSLVILFDLGGKLFVEYNEDYEENTQWYISEQSGRTVSRRFDSSFIFEP